LLGVAVPQGHTDDGRPHSAMVLGNALSDDVVLQFAAALLDEPRDRAPVISMITDTERISTWPTP
ncbi:amidase, partial [Streptomyces sp. SID10244]|nr:amidase [Streptomyces sp. SID10244]